MPLFWEDRLMGWSRTDNFKSRVMALLEEITPIDQIWSLHFRRTAHKHFPIKAFNAEKSPSRQRNRNLSDVTEYNSGLFFISFLFLWLVWILLFAFFFLLLSLFCFILFCLFDCIFALLCWSDFCIGYESCSWEWAVDILLGFSALRDSQAEEERLSTGLQSRIFLCPVLIWHHGIDFLTAPL